MPKHTDSKGAINLSDYKKVKELTNGKTNTVSLWEHKNDSNLKIVVKIPHGSNTDLIQHNIRSINAFFGQDSAWPVEGKIKGKQAFAMKYYQGEPLTPEEENNLVDNNNSSIRTINKNGLSFTMLDPNRDNFLKLATGEIIPIDFDYMIMHDGKGLLSYQEQYLEGRMGFAKRVGGASTKEAVQYVLESYPAAADYLREHWGKKYLETNKNTRRSEARMQEERLLPDKEPRIPSVVEANFNNQIELLTKKMSDFAGKPEFAKAYEAAETLYSKLKDEGKEYFEGKQSKATYQTFKKNCETYIETARIELDKHRGWSKIIANIVAAVCSGVVGYAIAVGINMAMNKGKCTFFSTESSLKIDAIEESIHQAAPTV